MNQIESADRQLKAALQSYASAVASIDRHVLPLQPALEPAYRRKLNGVRAAIGKGVIEATHTQVEEILAGFCAQTVGLLNARSEDIRQILLALAGVTETLEQDTYGEQFRAIASHMENTKHLVDLGEIRREITSQVAALNTVATQMQDASEATIAKLQTEMSSVQHRLDEAERLAETEPLTGLLNRRGIERRVAELIKKGIPFCVMLLDLNRFKGINDRYGHLVGDEMLVAFASRLLAEVRNGDPVCRWGGDEFLAVLCLPYAEASKRSQNIAQKVCGKYNLSGGLQLQVSATVGLSPHREGQTSKDVFAAADALLYSGKNALR